MKETLDKEAITEWIRSKMKALGNPPAYSYKVGIYHGLEHVLETIESGKFNVGEGDKE